MQPAPNGDRDPRGRARRPHPRFLQRQPRPLPDADSPETSAEADRVATATAWIDEPEQIGPGVADEFGAHAAWLREQERQARVAARVSARGHLTLEQRLANCRHLAKLHHADVSGDLHVIGGALVEARGRGRAPRDGIVRHLERLEGRLDSLL